jgi:hypothetical protein
MMDKKSAREEYRRLSKRAEVLRLELDKSIKDGTFFSDKTGIGSEKAEEVQEMFSRLLSLEDIFTEEE